jgi:hypothetical protein
MSILKVANVHFESTGTHRIDYVGGDSIIRISSGAIKVPTGGNGLRPTGEQGLIRYNSDAGTFEGHNGAAWGAIGGAVDLSGPWNTANAAFGQANLAFTQANNVGGAVTTANNTAIAAFGQANLAFTRANSAFAQANLAFVQANNVGGAVTTANNTAIAAFNKANTSVSANIITDTVSTTRYLVFANNTTGSFTQANVSTSLTFNPSSGTLSATIFNSTSDANKKTDITTIVGGLETIQSLRGVSFNWKDTGRPSYGLVAQEVEQIIPALVETDEDGNKTLNYDAVISFLVEAVKELSEKVKNG